MSKYMFVLMLSSAVPFILSFFPPLKFYRNLRAYVFANLLILFIFGSWDVFAIYRGHWSFASDGAYPIRIINLPLEEVLFFIVIPFCCIFTWEAMGYLRKRLK